MSQHLTVCCSVREKFVLPSDVLKWAPILSARSICHFDTFAIAADYELSRRRAALLEAYPGSGNSDLSTRLGVVVSELQARVLESSGDWQQVRHSLFAYICGSKKRTMLRSSRCSMTDTISISRKTNERQLISRSRDLVVNLKMFGATDRP